MSISIHFAGSRAVGYILGIPDVFQTDVRMIGYDFSEDVARIGWTDEFKLKFVGSLLSDRPKEVDFLSLRCAYASSYLPIAKKWPDTCQWSAEGDYFHKFIGEVMQTRRLTTTTLDISAQENDAPADALIMDTQGSEMDILKGGEEQVRYKTLIIYTEGMAVGMYEGQSHWWEVASHLAQRGFFMAKVEQHKVTPFAERMGWRGERFDWHNDTLYLKDLDYVVAHHADPGTDLRKLAFLALCNAYLEYSLAALRRSQDFPRDPAAPVLAYDRLLDDLLRTYDESFKTFTISYEDTHDVEIEQRRINYIKSGRGKDFVKMVNNFIHQRPVYLSILLRRYGLEWVANVIDHYTRADITLTLQLLGLDPNNIDLAVLDTLDA